MELPPVPRFRGRAAVALLLGLVAIVATGVALSRAPMPAGHGLPALSVPAIVAAGFVDGFNPCAFGVLLLFATFAVGLAAREAAAGQADVRLAGRRVVRQGSIFVSGVLLTYFVLGLGLLTVLTGISANHLPSRIAALLAIGMGLWMARDAVWPEARFHLEAPHALHHRMRNWARVTSPAALFGGGVLIGLCTVPCSGAIYLAVVALLGAGGSALAGLGGLALYNLAYIAPLVALLVVVSRPGVLRVVNRWHLEHTAATRLALAATAIGLGFAILLMV